MQWEEEMCIISGDNRAVEGKPHRTTVELWCRTRTGHSVTLLVEGLRPYMVVALPGRPKPASEATSGLRGDTLTAWLCDKDVDHYTLNVASLGAPCNPQAELRFDPSHSGAIQLDVMTTTGRWERAVVLRGAGWLKGHFGQKLSTTPIFKVSRTGSAQGALPYTIALGCAE